MSDESRKRVDESWKEQVQREKQDPAAAAAAQPATAAGESPARPRTGEPEVPEARFDLFLSGLAMDALIALGDMAHPTTKRQAMSLPHARYLIDLLGMLEEKTRGNLTADEERLLKDTLYQLRMRYMSKAR